MKSTPLTRAVTALRHLHGKPRKPRVTDPFAMALKESAAYLVDDARRDAVFARLDERTGCDPEAILALPDAELAGLIAEGGMMPAKRAAKLVAASEIALELGLDALRRAVREDDKLARRMLKRFPGFGNPGVEKVLLFNGRWKGLAPDSNVLRVLVRLGYGAEHKDYARMYRTANAAVEPELPDDSAWLVEAHQLLRTHGQTVCRNTAPRCGECPLADGCPSAA